MAYGNINVPGITGPELEEVENRMLQAIATHNVDTTAHPDIRQATQTAQATADSALNALLSLVYNIDVVPSQSGSLTFTGSAQSPAWNSYNPDALTLGGVTSGTNAGTYTATFTPKGNYHWSDGTTNPKQVTWTIGCAIIAKAPSQSGSLTYTGSAQSPTWADYSSTQLTIGGTTSGTNAGSYTVTFTPTSNYCWSDRTYAAKSVTWTIGRATVATPSQSGTLTYTGSAQSPTWTGYDTTKMTLGGTTSGTNAGSYNATFTPKANYQFGDGTITAKTVSWSIGKAAGSLTLNKTSLALTVAKTTDTITATRAGDGAVSATSSNTSVATVSVSGNTITVTGKANGTATITVSVAADINHTAPSNKTCSVTVTLPKSVLNDNSWATIREASSAGVGANYWAVGDTKSIILNGTVTGYTFSNLTVNAFILGFNHNSSKEGTKRIHFQLCKIGTKAVAFCDSQYPLSGTTEAFRMNTSNTNVGGWKDSYMRGTVLGNSSTPTSPLTHSLMAALPADLRAVIQAVTKYTDNVGNATGSVADNVTTTTDYLWLLAEFEVFGARNYANEYEQNSQAQYDYYKAGNSKIAYKHTDVNTAVWWWLRSPDYSSYKSFLDVSSGGSNDSSFAGYSGGVRPAFAV